MRIRRKFATAGVPDEIGGDGSRRFRAIASTTELDRDNDRILAYELDEFIANPVMLLDHDPRKLIGHANSIVREGKDLVIEYTLLPAGVSQHADFAYAARKHGTLRGHSIGFVPGKSTRNAEGGHDYSSVKLVEISLTGIQANPRALAANAGGKKSDSTGPRTRSELRELHAKQISDVVRRMQDDSDTRANALVDAVAKFAGSVLTKRGRVLSAENERRLRSAKRAGDELAAALAEVLAQVDEPEAVPEPVTVPASAPATEPKKPKSKSAQYLIRILPDPRDSGLIPVSPAVVQAATIAALESVVRKTFQRHTGRLD